MDEADLELVLELSEGEIREQQRDKIETIALVNGLLEMDHSYKVVNFGASEYRGTEEDNKKAARTLLYLQDTMEEFSQELEQLGPVGDEYDR